MAEGLEDRDLGAALQWSLIRDLPLEDAPMPIKFPNSASISSKSSNNDFV